MLSNLWGKITGADKKLTVQDQQAVALGRVGDYTIVFPYGISTDLPNDAMLRVIAPGIAIPWNIDRPSDGATGETMFFHPSTNTRIIARNNGDLDIIVEQVEGANGNINITCNQANVTAVDSVNITCDKADITATTSVDITAPLTKITGDLQVTGVTTLGTSVSINGKDIGETHSHAQGNDSAGNTEANIVGVL